MRWTRGDRRRQKANIRRRERGYLEGGGFALEVTGILTQDAEPGGTTSVDDRNVFNDLNCLAMLWTVRHYWLAGERFAFNCYRD